MKTFITRNFQKAYKRLTPDRQKAVDDKIQLLISNHKHPSLQSHRIRRANAKDVWGCYISDTDRLLYQFKNNIIYLWYVGSHAVIDRVHLRSFDYAKK